MANIVKYLEKILSSRYGEDVRGSIHDSIKAINDEVIDYGTEAGLKAKEAGENANLAKTYAEAAAESKESAQANAEMTAQDLEEVQRFAQEAGESAANAETQANLSKSYAVGTNDEVRENDSIDNAKYYKEQAELSSASALQSANMTSQKADAASLSESNAQQYALNAAGSEANAKISEENAKNSEENALNSENNALQSAVNSENSAIESSKSAESALKSAEDATTSELAAKGYSESAAESAARAEQVSSISLATQERAGIVKPDGTTITVDEDGTLHGANTVEVDGLTIEKTDDNILKIADALKKLIDNSVQQVKGKGLSANDFTDTLLKKLNSIEDGANKTVLTNNLATTVPGTGLDAVQGALLATWIEQNASQTDDQIGLLQEDVSGLEGDINELRGELDTLNTDLTNSINSRNNNLSLNKNLNLDIIGGMGIANNTTIIEIPTGGHGFMTVYLNDRGGNPNFVGGIVLIDVSQNVLSYKDINCGVSSVTFSSDKVTITLQQNSYWQYVAIRYNALN